MNDDVSSLKARGARRLALSLAFMAWFLFVPAGSDRFWQAWLFLGLTAAFWIFSQIYFLRHDPRLVERRLQNKEAQPEQRLFQRLLSSNLIVSFVLAGFDFRFGWSRQWIGPIPLAGVLAGEVLVIAGYWLVFWAMKTNTFAASTIQVEAGHRVIDSGPYAVVRHPMYTGMLMTALGAPFALGSYIAAPVFALIVPVLIYRLIHEERTLRRDLPGYAEYCERTRKRLVPFVW
jgi:protein-S-isoprenylcysteine O-methyltransferase Ste14